MIELMMVVVIIGILGAVVIPRISRLTARTKATEAAAIVQRDLERAFSVAARLRKSVVLTADNSARVYIVADTAGGTVRITRNLGETGESGVQQMVFSPTTITILPNGIASAPLTVTLTSHGSTRVVNMTRVGLIRRSQ
jgi:type II secretory pathway pseudopilin PulG